LVNSIPVPVSRLLGSRVPVQQRILTQPILSNKINVVPQEGNGKDPIPPIPVAESGAIVAGKLK
jgi:hypothetical protein